MHRISPWTTAAPRLDESVLSNAIQPSSTAAVWGQAFRRRDPLGTAGNPHALDWSLTTCSNLLDEPSTTESLTPCQPRPPCMNHLSHVVTC